MEDLTYENLNPQQRTAVDEHIALVQCAELAGGNQFAATDEWLENIRDSVSPNAEKVLEAYNARLEAGVGHSMLGGLGTPSCGMPNVSPTLELG